MIIERNTELLDMWALIPARGGSKSIPKKNIALLNGRPMIDYGVKAAIESSCFSRIICSTDDKNIADRARYLGVDIDIRSNELSGDDVAVADVAIEYLMRQNNNIPDWLFLVQPTSPFLLVKHILSLMTKLQNNPDAMSGQTITPVSHNNHAWNQRSINANGITEFKFKEDRMGAYNKQRKPKLYTFGNLVAVKPEALFKGMGFFAEPSIGCKIESPYNFDVDNFDDLQFANMIIGNGLYLDYDI
jgi:CMP-N-acetylneuraminic acid synthetase